MKYKIKEGILQEYNEFVVLGKTHYNYKVYAEDGYCFYDKTNVFVDEQGVEQKNYMRFIIIPPSKSIDDFVVVPIQSEFGIVN